mgnify:FL=1
MSLNNDTTRCTGIFVSSAIAWETECPCREKCQRYTDKPANHEYTPMMNAPKIRKSGCQLKIEVNK